VLRTSTASEQSEATRRPPPELAYKPLDKTSELDGNVAKPMGYTRKSCSFCSFCSWCSPPWRWRTLAQPKLNIVIIWGDDIGQPNVYV
jgi:hypothetical protein